MLQMYRFMGKITEKEKKKIEEDEEEEEKSQLQGSAWNPLKHSLQPHFSSRVPLREPRELCMNDHPEERTQKSKLEVGIKSQRPSICRNSGALAERPVWCL